MQADITQRASDLKTQGKTFVIATVVRTLSVTAAKAGAKALLNEDADITDGWIGGGCAKSAVQKAAREALADGQPRLVSLRPEELLDERGLETGSGQAGVELATNHCPSKGTMDIFVEPVLPQPEILVLGDSPVAEALAEIGGQFGFFCNHMAAPDCEALPPTNARRYIVVSTQGKSDRQALALALLDDADYVAFVGSRKKTRTLLEMLKAEGLKDEELERLKAPAGLDIGAITPDEIALSIVAEIVKARRDRQKKP